LSAWRRRAIEQFPELRPWFEDEQATPHTMWFELLPLCHDAHVEGNRATLKKIYDYAEWCFRQENPRVINAVAVSFYEHLIDEPGTYNAMPDWVSYDIFLEIADLLVD
jgi:hypothetical protein